MNKEQVQAILFVLGLEWHKFQDFMLEQALAQRVYNENFFFTDDVKKFVDIHIEIKKKIPYGKDQYILKDEYGAFFTTRAYNVLKSNDIKTIGRLIEVFNNKTIYRFKDCGAKTVREIEDFFKHFNIDYKTK